MDLNIEGIVIAKEERKERRKEGRKQRKEGSWGGREIR